ncbi:MAG: hypothetical protein ACI9VT_003811 [Psychroserpens sp.]|jgi:hypothetical protein
MTELPIIAQLHLAIGTLAVVGGICCHVAP